MIQQCLERLGLQPGADLAAIRKAYARELRHCRPDDDPEGYQQLRQAYDVLVQYTRAAADTHDTDPAAADPTASMPAQPQDHPSTWLTEDHTEVDAEGFIAAPAEPEQLARSLHEHLLEHGPEAGLALWPQLQAKLDAMPLAMRDQTSWWFARMMVECAELPAALCTQLADHFHWHTDYRSQLVLGPELANGVLQLLRDIGHLRTRNPQLLRRFALLLRLQELLQQQQRWHARLLAVLAPARQREKLLHSDDALLLNVGLPQANRAGLDTMLKVGGRIRLGLALLVVLGLAWLLGGSDQSIADSAPLLLLATLGVRLCWLLDPTEPLYLAELRQISERTRLVCALILLVVMAWMAAMRIHVPFLLLILGSFVLQLTLSVHRPWSSMLIPLTLVLGYVLMLATGLEGAQPFILAGIVVLLGHWGMSLLQRLLVPFVLQHWIPRSYGAALKGLLALVLPPVFMVVVAMLLLCTPMLYIAQARFYGNRFALTSLGLAAGLGILFANESYVPLLLVMLMPICTGLAQHGFGVLARRWLQVGNAR